MRFRSSEVASATGGRLVGDDVELTGASFDSRSIGAGQLFVPIVAERDGHDFAGAAVSAGAAAYLTSRGIVAEGPAIEVADTAAALMDLAAWGARRLGDPSGAGTMIVGVTGSVGKTSTKDLAASAIGAGRRTTANERSFNNEQGLPVTVLNAPDDTEVLIVEMGMRGFGEIARLCAIAPPTIGIVTAVAAAHTAMVGGLDGVARAKGELVEALPATGTAVLNADDAHVLAMAGRTDARVVTFGESPASDVRVVAVELDELARPTIRVVTPWGDGTARLAVSGRHMAGNAAAALAAAGSVGVDLATAISGLERATLSPGRMTVHRLNSGGVLVNDAYNANPTSMRASLQSLVAIPAERRIAVLGVMAELDDPASGHAEIAGLATALGIELVPVGTDLYGRPPVDDPIEAVGPIGRGTAVVVKASLVGGLQAVAAELLARNR
ncbi:UDP-N-acetylmuramoyl-tripeptide--D-alanyl-D-alanine ligase [Desertimonas flava]|uniref:UDP-N-acetylmuramoyl-tripeptide--D-alanyl-D- alanine ligase n=1 Tax=Desertimonas flava TaxID=2064846 RepID=UPI000E351BC7|nr:UDP-N-acetylmuramoyl-tripeptide--D-alanyl-D-alanine ligase [Desertimonas flava]